MENVVIYTRGKKGENIQESICSEYCSRNNLNVLEVFREINIGPGRRSFPEHVRMIEYLSDKSNVSIVVTSFDRLARRKEDFDFFSEFFKKRNIQFVAVDQPQLNLL